MVVRAGAALVVSSMLPACHWTALEPPSGDAGACNAPTAGAGRPLVRMDYAQARNPGHGDSPSDVFFLAPFPARGRTPGDPTGVADAPNFPAATPLNRRLLPLVSTDGYAVSAAIFFGLSGEIDSSIPLPRFGNAGAPTGGAPATPSVLVFPMDEPRALAPTNVRTTSGNGDVPVLLSVLPVQGRPLAENTEYVVIVTTQVAQRDESPASLMKALCTLVDGGASPPYPTNDNLTNADDVAKYVEAIGNAITTYGFTCEQIAAISVFRTSDPTAEMRAVQAKGRSDYLLTRGQCPVPLGREMSNGSPYCNQAPYCMFSGQVLLPQYQRGTPPFLPYAQWGGGWPASTVPAPKDGPLGCDSSAPSAPGATETDAWAPTWKWARVVVTIPHADPPPEGYPVVAYVRAGAGGPDDPIVDRGPQLEPSCSDAACRGPAEVFQSAGFAGIAIDGPLTGRSRQEPGFGSAQDEDFAIYNFLNPLALRDNLRQSAFELTLLPDVLGQIQFDPSDQCWGVSAHEVKFDLSHLVMFSHSMGSSIGPLALAGDPRYRAAILSGSGGSTIENVIYKANPLPIDAAGSLVGLPSSCAVTENDFPLSLLEWALEPSDSQVYARRMVTDAYPSGATWWSPNARHVLMIQGLVDRDILPPIADSMTLAEGLGLGLGANFCGGDPHCDLRAVHGVVASPGYPSLGDLLGLSGAHYGALEAMAGNVPWPAAVPRPPGYAGDLTALVVQHRIDENRESSAGDCQDNGHEAIYESTLARHQYGCFLYDFLHNETPRIRGAGEELAPCDP